MGKEIVLLTGATGFIGFRVLQDLLALPGRPYTVRLAVRSQSKAETIKNHASIRQLNLSADAFEVAIIPELDKKGAYTEAIKDVKYVIHVASPIPQAGVNMQPAEMKEAFEIPAVRGTMELLEAVAEDAAQKVRRVVITSSTVALLSKAWLSGQKSFPTVLTERTRVPDYTANPETLNEAYVMSKTAALNAAERWLDENKHRLNFSVVHVHPTITIGRDDLATTPAELDRGSNHFVIAPLTGGIKGATARQRSPSSLVAVEDISFLHLAGMDETKIVLPNGAYQSLLGSTTFQHETAFEVAQKYVPEATKPSANGRPPILTNEALAETFPVPTDTTETRRLTGIKFKTGEEMVKNLLEQYVELATAAT